MSKKAQNLRRGIGRLDSSIVEDLNKIGETIGKPTLGTQLAREVGLHLARIGNQLDLQAGHGGTVKIAKQGKDAQGKIKAGLTLQNDRVTGVAWAKQGTDAVPLDQFRSFLTCDWFLQMVEDCVDLPENEVTIGTAIPDCWRT